MQQPEISIHPLIGRLRFNKDFKAELLKDLEKEGVTYIKLEGI